MKVVLINGIARSGKDTFVSMVTDCAPDDTILNVSTVDFVKEVAKFCGWNGEKTPENRWFLSSLKDLLTNWNDVPVTDIKNRINEFCAKKTPEELEKCICFVHTREPEELARLTKELGAYSVCVRRDEVESIVPSNHADANILNYQYDCYINNNGTLDELKRYAEVFYRQILRV